MPKIKLNREERGFRRRSRLTALVFISSFVRINGFVHQCSLGKSLNTHKLVSLSHVTTRAKSSSTVYDAGPMLMSWQSEPPGEGTGDDFGEDDSSFEEMWRKRRIDDLLSHPQLYPDMVNEILEPSYIDRQRFVLHPEEAFGAIFHLDTLTDVAKGLVYPLWVKIAEEYKYPTPTLQQVQRSMGMTPRGAIETVFRWTTDVTRIKQITLGLTMYLDELAEKASANNMQDVDGYTAQALPGVDKWLEKLSIAGVHCGVVSRLPKALINGTLERAGIGKYFEKTQIGAEDGFERDLQGFLKCSLLLERPPAKCAVFDCRRETIVQAHEGQFKVVAMVGAFPVYELGAADLISRGMTELHVAHIRRIFADKSPEPELQMEPEVQKKYRPVMTLTRTRVEEEEFKPRRPRQRDPAAERRDKRRNRNNRND